MIGKERFIFVDFDDTLSDNFQFNLQYVRELGALLAPKFGGEGEAWAKSATDMLATIEAEYVARFVGAPLAGYCAWLETIRARSVELLFGGMGVAAPADAASLAIDNQFSALTACDAAFPGASEALMALFEDGVRTQIASGQESEYLLAALMGAGVESFTESKFGPDLVDCAKEGPEFYARIFAASGVAAGETLVIDDRPDALGWAMATGAKTIQARLSPVRHFETVPGVVAVLTNLRDLPALVAKHL